MPTPAERPGSGALASQHAATVLVAVVNYGASDLLAENLVATTDATPGLDVVVVDNLSSPEERRALLTLGRRQGWRVLTPEANLGFGTGNNLAVAAAGPAVRTVVLLNPDARLGPDDLRHLVEHVEAHPGTLVSPRVLRPDGTQESYGSDLLLASGEMRGWHKRPADADPASYQPWLSGACLAMSRSLWERVGGFDDDYFLYWEDVDLCRRVLDAGGQLELLETASAVHDQGATHREQTSTREKSPTYYYWNVRNRLVFAGKHLSPADQRRWLRTSLGAGYRLLLQGGRRQLRHPSRTVLPVLRGIRDGRRALHRT